MRGHEAPARSPDVGDLELRHSRGVLSMTSPAGALLSGKAVADLRLRGARRVNHLAHGGAGEAGRMNGIRCNAEDAVRFDAPRASGAARRLGVGLAMAVVPVRLLERSLARRQRGR